MAIGKVAEARNFDGPIRGLDTAQALKAPSDPGVAMELKMLHAALENLGQRTEHLFSRLEGVMRPSAPAVAGDGRLEAKEPSLSPVAREIAMGRHHVGRILTTINEMHARLDA